MKGRLLIKCIELVLYVSVSFAAVIPKVNLKTFDQLIEALQEHHDIPVETVKRFFELDDFFYNGSPNFVGQFAVKDSSNLYILILKHYEGNYVRDILITMNRKHQQIRCNSILSRCKKCNPTDSFADVSFEGNSGWRQIKIEYYEPIFQKAKILESQRKIRKTEYWLITTKGYIVQNTKTK